jgi:parallel beta-helix repeat protein
LTNYQKGGITVNGSVSATITNNAVTGQGPVNYIAQNGIQVGYGAKATVSGNTVTGNAYTGASLDSSGGILVVGGPCFGLAYTVGLSIMKNTVTNNDIGVWLFNATGTYPDCVATTTKTNNAVKFNTISNGAVTNTSGYSVTPACGYQVGIADVGHKDLIVNNTISGLGYTPQTPDCSGATPAFLRHVDLDSSARAKPSNK